MKPRFHPALSLTLLWMIALSWGCARSMTTIDVPPPPPVFAESMPDIGQLAAAINRTDAIRELSTNSARVDVLSMPAVPKLSASMHLQRERRFRFRANIPLMMGTGLDLGSNESDFWFEVPEGMSQTLYFANHDQYAQQLDRAILPVDPTWMIEAIGLPRLDPATVLAGPVARDDGMLEIRTAQATPAGTYQRVLLIEPSAGYVTHLFLYSPDGRMVAKSTASQHRYYETVNSVLPHLVKMELFPAIGPPLAMQLEVADYTVNQLLTGDANVFVMPATARNRVNLVELGREIVAPPSMMGSAMPTPPPSAYSTTAPTAATYR